MEETKRPFVPFTYYWSEHFSTWVIRDADNHEVAQVDTEERARLIVTAVNHFEEMRDMLQELEEYMSFSEIKSKARALLAKIREG